MRRFHSYGSINTKLHYYVPREKLIENAYTNLVGESTAEGGRYFTVWAPRQTGKTWIMQQILLRLKKDPRFHVLKLNLEILKEEKNVSFIISTIAEEIGEGLNKNFTGIKNKKQFQEIFKKGVLGIENQEGSPFNVQRSVHIPNLTFAEVEEMFKWYEKESGQKVDEAVVRELYEETRGQPGLTCWFGELLTETYNHDTRKPITMTNFKESYAAATHILPNNNILNLISKVDKPPYDEIVMEFFKTGEKIAFNFDDKNLNYLYMNGVINEEKVGLDEYYVKFSSPFVQKRIFNFFSRQIFGYLGQLIHPLDAMKDAVDEESLHIPNIIKRYQAYLKKNRETFFKDVPRRKTDLKIYEAIYHFNLYRYLYDLLRARGVEVIPHFPTGNGKVDLILKYREKIYALELKSFKDMYTFEKSIDQAAEYGRQMGLKEIALLVFVELSEEEAKQLEKEIDKPGIKVIVLSVGIL
jgi:hypothetical protein